MEKNTNIEGQFSKQIEPIEKVLIGEELKEFLTTEDPATGKSIGENFFDKYGVYPKKYTLIESQEPPENQKTKEYIGHNPIFRKITSTGEGYLIAKTTKKYEPSSQDD